MIELTANKTPPRLSNDGGESNSSKYSNKLLSQPHKAIIRQRDSKPEHMDPSSPKYIDLNVRKDQRKKSLVHFILREFNRKSSLQAKDLKTLVQDDKAEIKERDNKNSHLKYAQALDEKMNYQKVQLFDLITVISIITSNFVFVIQYPYEFSGLSPKTSNILLLLGLVLSLGALVSFTIKKHIELKYLKETVTSYSFGMLIKGCWFRWVIFLLQPMPFIVGYRVYFYVPPIQDYVYYHLNDFLNMLSIIRLCYSIGKIIIFSSWMSHSAKRVCSLYGSDHDLLFAIKCVVRGQPITVAVVLLWLTILVYANTARICEAPIDRVFKSTMEHTYLNSVWEVILTTTTIGFGDIFPRTIFGRFFMILCAFNGVFVVSLMVLAVTNTFNFDSIGNRAYIVTSKVSLRKDIKISAAKIIQRFLRLRLGFFQSKQLQHRMLVRLKQEVIVLKTLSKEYQTMKEPSLQHGMSAEFEITNKTQKEIQHSISLLASMVSAREFELLSTSIDKQDATLLSSLTGITKKRVQEKLIEVQAKNSKEFKEETSRLNQTPSPKRQIDNLRSKDESSPQMENLSDNYDDHASSIESFGARRLLTHRAGEGSPPRRESPPLLIHSIKNMDKLPKIKSDPSPIQYEFKFSEVPTITRSKDISATPEQGRTSRSKEKVPVPIRVLRSHMSKPSGDMDHPPM